MSSPVDVVVAWVDGSDPKWLAERREYDPKTPAPDSGDHRYRDWGLLRFLFRGIERYMPWVRMVHFVTWGHLPGWLNVNCAKLNVVRHDDYIPQAYLPTFSSHTIELNFHRIAGLAEQFVYFNDDQYVLRPTKACDFFANGLPRDIAALNVHPYKLSRPIDLIQVRDVGVVNEHFDFRPSVTGSLGKWLRPQNGSTLIRTLPLLGSPRFPGFYQTHCAQSLLKSTFDEVWDAEPALLDETCRHKFRNETDVNQWVMREWQIASGRFVPRRKSFCRAFYLDLGNPVEGARDVAATIQRQRHPLICINDADMCDEYLEKAKAIVRSAFEGLLPTRSQFELDGSECL